MPKKNSLVDLQTADINDKPAGGDWQPDEDQIKRKGKFMSDWQQGITFRSTSGFDTDVIEWIERYKGRPFSYEDGRAGVVVPIGKAIIETAQAQESKNPPSFAYLATENPGDVAKAKILELIVTKFTWNQKHVDLDYKMDVLNQDKMILGTMYQYIGYAKMYRTIREKNKAADGKVTTTTKEELFYDDVVVENIYPQDVWLHPLASRIADSPWIVVRKRYDKSSFLERYSDREMYNNLEYVKAGMWFTAESEDYAGSTITRTYDDKNEVVVIEYWNKMTDEVIFYANGIEIFYEPNPYDDKELPFSDYRNRMQYNTYLGESEMERIAALSDAVNAFINIAIDKEKRAGTGINLIDSSFSDFDDTATVFSASEATRVDNPKDAFVHYDVPGMSGGTDKIIQMLLDFLVFTTGVDFRQITDLTASTKATVAALRRQITLQRMELNISRNENCGVKRLGWLLGKRVQQFYTLPKINKVTGKEGEEELTYKKIQVQDLDISEEAGPDGKYSAESLKMKGRKDGAISFFQARPEYLRLEGDFCVRTIPGSTLATIQELEKNKAQEFVKLSTEVMGPPSAEGGAPEPLLSVRYGLEMYVKAMGYDLNKAFDTKNKAIETPAQDMAQDLIGQMNGVMGGQVNMENGNAGAASMVKNGVPRPPQKTPPSATGSASEPVREFQNKMSVNSRITNKKAS